MMMNFIAGLSTMTSIAKGHYWPTTRDSTVPGASATAAAVASGKPHALQQQKQEKQVHFLSVSILRVTKEFPTCLIPVMHLCL